MNTNTDKIDLSRTIYEAKRHWLYYVISLVLIMGFAGFYMYKKNPVYLFHANMLIEQEDNSAAGGGMMQQMMRSFSMGSMGGGSVDDEILVMQSHSLLRELVSELKLNRTYIEKDGVRNLPIYTETPIEILAPDEIFDTLSLITEFQLDIRKDGLIDIKAKQGLFKTVYEAEDLKLPFTVSLPSGGIFAFEKTDHFVPGEEKRLKIVVSGNEYMAETYSDQLVIDYASKKSNGIGCSIEDTNIARGKDILNKLLELYNRRRTNEKHLKASNEIQFIDQRLASLTGQLSDAEKKMEQFKTDNNVTDIEVEAKVLLEQTSANKQSIVEIQTQLAIFDMICNFLDDPANRYSMIPVTSGVDYESAAKSIEAYNELVLKRMEINMSAKKDNVNLQVLNSQIDGMRSGVVETMNKARESAEIRYRDFVKEDGKFATRLKNLPAHEREYINLLRDQTIKNDLYIFLLEQRESSFLKLGSNSSMGRIVDAAYNEVEPITPKGIIVFGIALIVSLLLPTLLMVYKSLRLKRIEISQDIVNLSAIPVLAEITNGDGIAGTTEDSERICEFRTLRNKILADASLKTLYLTSVPGFDNRSYIAANLANLLSLTGKKTVVVDADNTSVFPASENFAIRTIRETAKNASEILLSDAFSSMIGSLKAEYDYVIVCGPSIANDHSLSVARNLYDKILAAVAQGTDKRSCQIASNELSAVADISGILFIHR